MALSTDAQSSTREQLASSPGAGAGAGALVTSVGALFFAAAMFFLAVVGGVRSPAGGGSIAATRVCTSWSPVIAHPASPNIAGISQHQPRNHKLLMCLNPLLRMSCGRAIDYRP